MSPQHLTPTFAISPQIAPADIASLKAQGFAALINNRPDGEEPGQPQNAEIQAAAHAAGLAYAFIPVAGGLTPEAITATQAALATLPQPILAFCRSGARSTYLFQAATQA